ncbi:MAG: hypothetical protein K6F84_05630 [Lachnospiraceae bacterium]|nr:hypothetical protein [Lachnospiraceae bacterium]
MCKINFIGGDEPFMVDHCINQLTRPVTCPELNLRETDSFDINEVDFIESFPFAGNKKALIYKVDNLETGYEAVKSYVENPPKTCELIVRFKDFDARKTGYKTLNEKGLVFLCNKEKYNEKLPDFIKKQTLLNNSSIEDDAVCEFMIRENYIKSPEVSLYTINSDIHMLSALGSVITLDMIKTNIPYHDVEEVFSLSKMIINKDVEAITRQITVLKGNEIGALSAILRELRISLKATAFSLKDIGAYTNVFGSFSKEFLLKNINELSNLIFSVKSGLIPADVALKKGLFSLIS